MPTPKWSREEQVRKLLIAGLNREQAEAFLMGAEMGAKATPFKHDAQMAAAVNNFLANRDAQQRFQSAVDRIQE